MKDTDIFPYLILVGLVPLLVRRHARHLGSVDAPISKGLICPNSSWHIVIAALLEGDCKLHAVLHRLSCSLYRRRQERMCSVTNRRDSSLWRDESWQRISKHEFVINKAVCWRCIDSIMDYWGPSLQVLLDLLLVTGELPIFIYISVVLMC